jgi:ABC-type transport system involved in multi-copper enzyme maturation permease subunit
MLGPFRWTLLSTTRRDWYVRARRWYSLWLVILMVLVYDYLRDFSSGPWLLDLLRPARLAGFSRTFADVFWIQHFALLLAVAPAMAAGSITEEKSRGTLEYLLTTALGPHEIILSKWLAQSLLIAGLALVGLPLFCLFGGLAGVELPGLVAFISASLLLILATNAASLLSSVWCRKTVTTVLAVYALGGLVAGAVWYSDRLGFLFAPFNLSAIRPDAAAFGAWLSAVAVWSIVTVGCLLVAGWRLRPAYMKQLAGAGKPRRAWFQRPPVGNIPLRWKERYVGELAAIPFLRHLPRWVLLTAVVAVTLAVSGDILTSPDADTLFLLQGLTVALLFGLATAIRSAGAVSGERERQSWDLLLITPLEVKQILRGKLWGIIDSARVYLLAYLLSALACAALAGPLAIVWVLFWWVCAWLLMYFMGAVGIDSSARANNSWRSLLATLTANMWFMVLSLCLGGAAGWVVMFLLGNAIISGGSWLLAATLAGITSCTVTGVLLFAKTEELLEGAERHLATEERVAQRKPNMRSRFLP